MKVAFIGTHCVGKTSVLKLLAEDLGVPAIEEGARVIADEWGLTPATIPQDRLIEYQYALLERQILEETRHPLGFLSDRSVVDNMAYMLALPHATSEQIIDYQMRAAVRLPHYDRFILFPYGKFKLVDDGERHVDAGFQKEIHNTILALIDQLDLGHKVYEVRTEGVYKRVAELRPLLRLLQQKGRPA